MLNGQEPGDVVLRRKNSGETGKGVMWPDYSVNEYIYRPDCLEHISFFEFVLSYDRVAMSFQRMKNKDQSGMPILQDG
jgi:hypothetical protein